MGEPLLERATRWRAHLAHKADAKRRPPRVTRQPVSPVPAAPDLNAPDLDATNIDAADLDAPDLDAPDLNAPDLNARAGNIEPSSRPKARGTTPPPKSRSANQSATSAARQPVHQPTLPTAVRATPVAVDDYDTIPTATPTFEAKHANARWIWLTKLKAWHAARRKRLDATAAASALTHAQVQAPVVVLPERQLDLVLLGAVMALLTIGTIEIYSATAAEALTQFGNPNHFVKKQIMFVGLGGIAMWLGTRLDYNKLRRWTYPMLAAAVVLLFAALLFPARNGAHRWVPLGPLTFQPVEVAKLALITYLAYSLASKADRIKTFTIGFVPHLIMCGVMVLLLLKQPDLGSSIVLGLTTLGVLFVAGTRISYIMLAFLAAAPIGYQLVVGTPWRMQRMLAYFNPEAFANKEAYQFLQARLALGSGGLFGNGLGGGQQTLGYMPESQNDFILAPIGEELGFFGVALVISLFAVLIWRGLRAALGARDAFGGYLALGITVMFGVQALFNIGVVLGVIPNKGITLPLVSYGGSSLCVTMFLVGLLLNVGKRPERRGATTRAQAVAQPTFAVRKKQRVQVVLG